MERHDDILVHRSGVVATVTLNRPERRNALSLDLLRALVGVFDDLGDDPALGAIILAGAGTAFSAGHDLSEMIDRPPEFYAELFDTSGAVMTRIHQVPQPVIAKVQGVATAAGCQLAAACDLVVASEHATFATPGVQIGLFCSTPMVPISRAVGRKRALEMLLTGDPIDAATARDWGLVNTVVPAEELDDAVDTLAARITRYSRDTVRIGKHAFYSQIDVGEQDAYAVTKPVMAGNAATEDAQEGMGAFLDKRDPMWSHAATRPSDTSP